MFLRGVHVCTQLLECTFSVMTHYDRCAGRKAKQSLMPGGSYVNTHVGTHLTQNVVGPTSKQAVDWCWSEDQGVGTPELHKTGKI